MDYLIKPLDGGVTAPSGYRAAGVHCGIKRQRRDVALLVSDVPAASAGMFTTNQVKGEPLILSMPRVRSGRLQAIVANSGNANVCTGAQGLSDAAEMAEMTAAGLGLNAELVAVASTGIIGLPLPMDKIRRGIAQALQRLDEGGGGDAAEAIMTTDKRAKEAAFSVRLQGGDIFHLGGMAKGSGMIHPQMATMFAFISTDAAIEAEHLQQMLARAVDDSFNMITVDGDTSTSDMVICMANGLSGVSIEPGSSRAAAFEEALSGLCRHLAREIVRDGEGASHLVSVHVSQAADRQSARRIAFAVAGSNLFKTAVFGRDPNWGRIICAVGYAGPDIDPRLLEISMAGVPLAVGGVCVPFDAAALKKALAAEEVQVDISLGLGEAEAVVWTCDLTYDYVRINARYHT